MCHLSEFILDLDPQCKTVNLLFECSIKKNKLLEGIKTRGKMPLDKYVTNHIKDSLERKVYTFKSEFLQLIRARSEYSRSCFAWFV